MNSEIITIGTELLVGNILNTNAKYLSEELTTLGFNISKARLFFLIFNILVNKVNTDNVRKICQCNNLQIGRDELLPMSH